MIRVGLIGAGRTGQKRAGQLGPGAKLVAVADQDQEAAARLAAAHQAAHVPDPNELARSADVDAVIVSTFNLSLPAYGAAALKASKHVLLEKPAARRVSELLPLVDRAVKSGRILGIGFNHRFHPALQRARKLLLEGEVGRLMYIRARYGHGARVGYESEWRANPALSGGGELLDQGVHLIDLCRWMGGEFDLEYGQVYSFFWKMPVEDNGVLVLRSPDRLRSAFLHASCTEWKNLFDFEIFGETGKIQVSGLGRSYGTEELRVYRMKPGMGPPELEVTRFEAEDRSWESELQAFLKAIRGEVTDLARGHDAIRALEIVEAVYRMSAQAGARPEN